MSRGRKPLCALFASSLVDESCCLMLNLFNSFTACQANTELIGPTFRLVPPFSVQFSNDTGAKIDCTAFGNPTPQIQWYLGKKWSCVMSLRIIFLDCKFCIFFFFRGRHEGNDHTEDQNGAPERQLGVSRFRAQFVHARRAQCSIQVQGHQRSR